MVFLIDDMGLMDTSVPFVLGADGRPEAQPLNAWYRTPGMERLAAQGIRFTQFYANSVCSPTRTSILTGQAASRHRVTQWIRSEQNNRGEFGPPDWNWTGLEPGDTTMPGVLREAGYRTIFVGKAHFGPSDEPSEFPQNLGFDVNIAGCSWGQPGSYFGQDGYGHIKGNKRRAVPDLADYHGTDTFLTDALTLEAIKQVDVAVRAEQPFFLYLGHYAVHTPFQTDPQFVDDYKNRGYDARAQAYATLIAGMDKSLDELLDHLVEAGVAENTLVLFLGDNGGDAPLGETHGHGPSAPFRGKKGTHYEGGMRVPFIAAWAKPNPDHPVQRAWPIPAGGVQTQFGTVMDLYPTVLSLAGLDNPQGHTIDGDDLKTQLLGQANPDRSDRFLMHFPHAHRSSYYTVYRANDWKLIYHYRPNANPAKTRYELFNLADDPYETTNLAEGRPEKLRQMVRQMTGQLDEHEALYPVDAQGNEVRPIVP
ncbi:MAG: sulfatase [Planctomycetota bacterium]